MTAGLIVFPFWPSLIWGPRTTGWPECFRGDKKLKFKKKMKSELVSA